MKVSCVINENQIIMKQKGGMDKGKGFVYLNLDNRKSYSSAYELICTFHLLPICMFVVIWEKGIM